MDNRNRTLAAVLVWAALGILIGQASARAEPAAASTAADGGVSPAPAASSPASTAKPSTEPLVQVSGRVIHTWFEKPGLRVMLVIDGFTVLTRQDQVTARDGVIWFDEEEAKKTGKASLGVYAETGVEYRQAGGRIERYDSVYLVIETTGEVSLHAEEPLRGKADNTELFLRAKKLRQEYLTRGIREQPTDVVAPPPETPKTPLPGVREAGVPQEISIVAQDDVRQVNFTSFVENGVRISIWSGGIYLSRDDMEIAADNVVIWTPEEATRQAVGSGETGEATPAETGPAAEGKTGTAAPEGKVGGVTQGKGSKIGRAHV